VPDAVEGRLVDGLVDVGFVAVVDVEPLDECLGEQALAVVAGG
jgi:hypothetical protein